MLVASLIVAMDDLCYSIRFAAVVHETGHSPRTRCINDFTIVKPKEIAATHALFLVVSLSPICYRLSDFFPDVFDQNITLGE
jgi:hypothetical protein